VDLLYYSFLAAAGFAVALAVFGFIRHRGSPGYLCFGIGLLLLAAETTIAAFGRIPGVFSNSFSVQTWIFLPKSLLPGFWFLFSVLYSRGNSPLSRKTIAFSCTAFALPIACVFLFQDYLFKPLPFFIQTEELPIGLAGYVYYVFVLLCSAILLMNLEKTFRAAIGTYRWRIKFLILAVGLLFTGRVYTSSQILIFQNYFPTVDIINAVTLFVSCCLIAVGFSRKDTFKVAVYPSDKVLRVSLTAVLLATYLVIVGLSSKILEYWEGPNAFATKALLLLVSLSFISILLLSERNRESLARFVSRHFRRPLYDYRSVWLSFTERTSSITSAESLCQVVVKWLSEEFHVLSSSIWIKDSDLSTLRMVASTGTSAKLLLSLEPDLAQQLQNHFLSHPVPLDLERASHSWVEHLRQIFPVTFKKGANRICVPLTVNGQFLGLLTLGDRVNNVSFGLQDFDLLKCVADQIASNLLNFQLSSRLVQVKEMEAFQTIAAFFVHDLKNTSSSLSLTLQNLPKHFDNPEFRKDALKAISKSVSHIQDLIARLTLFRQRIELHPRPIDLNELLKSTLSSAGDHIKVKTDFPSPATVLADEDQLQKVFINLLINAREAVAVNKQGEITLSTLKQNGWAIATVTDNGCGMTPDFVSHSLFKPFKTTKKGGMGIGMFQSKTIVEAHKGKIEVDSQQGRGTTFRVFLPASA
jgi:putative PEP-CTERM system histidine kinase